MNKKRCSVFGLALGALVLGVLVGLITVGTVAADPAPGVRFQIPRIDIGDDTTLPFPYGGYGTGDWGTWIHVQNVSLPDPVTGIEPATGAIFFGWRAPVLSDTDIPLCPPNDRGPFVAYCQLIQGNAVWTLRSQLDEEIKSAIIYSVPADVFEEACDDAADALNDTQDWLDWEEEYAFQAGAWDLAITVNRYGPNDHGTFISSTYTGISEDMDGDGPTYEYFAPYVMKGYYGLDTEFTIQNSGWRCSSVWIDYLQQTSCTVVFKWHIEQLAPGEAIRVRVPKEVNLFDPNGCGWLGSAHITGEQPLGVIVDQTSSTSNQDSPCFGPDPGTLLTYRARPRLESRDGVPMVDYKHYADLIFREWSGWSSSIQVQNLSNTGQHTFVTVDFMDNSGDEILFLADWVCPGGSTTFYLPAVTNLGFDYVGAAEIESHAQIAYPGQSMDAQPIFAVVDLKKADNPLTTGFDPQGGSYNAHPLSQKERVTGIALPFIAKDAKAPDDPYTPWTSMIAIRNNSNCNKIKPTIWFKDETGRLICEISSFWLHPKHLKLIDLTNIGCLHAGYIGAAKVIIYPEDVEQLCDVDRDGRVDNEPTMPSVVVVEKGVIGFGGVEDGDVTKIYEGIPYRYEYGLCQIEICGQVIDELTLDPINGAEIYMVEFAEAPFTVSGTAYIDPTVGCPDPEGALRLGDRDVELQVEYFDDPDGDGIGVWRWATQADTTTNGDGSFAFVDALDLETGDDPAVNEDGDERNYRLSISVTRSGATVTYVSGVFDDSGDVEVNFTIGLDGGSIDITSGEWCDPIVTLDETVSGLLAETDSTGHFCFDYEKTAEPEDINVRVLHTDYFSETLTLEDVECDDQVLNFELNPTCDTVRVHGHVEDKMTGEYINGATVRANNCVVLGDPVTYPGGYVETTTNAYGYYWLELPFDPDCTTWVWAFAEDYNSSYDSVFIPICDEAAIDFQLRQTPKAKVLLYYGNGGIGPTDVLTATGGVTYTLSYYHLEEHLETFGKTVVYTDVWPNQFDWTTKYELIVLLGPGHDTYSVTVPYSESVAVNGFTWGQKAELDFFLQQDGKLVILSDASGVTGQDVENDLLQDLPVDLRFNQNYFEDGHGDQITPDCLTNQVQVYSTADSLVPDNWTDVSATDRGAVPGDLILQNAGATLANGQNRPMYAMDVPAHGNGWVIVLGDMHGLSDGAWLSNWNWSADNEDLARNWLVCDP